MTIGVNFCKWYEIWVKTFLYGSFNCSRTICWKAYPFAISFWLDDPNLHSFCHWKTFYSCCKSTDQIHVSLFLNSLFCSTNLCVYLFTYTALSNFLVSFEIIVWSSNYFAHLSQLFCCYSSPFLFHVNFTIDLFISTKSLVGFLLKLYWSYSYRSFGGMDHLNNVEFSNQLTWSFFQFL